MSLEDYAIPPDVIYNVHPTPVEDRTLLQVFMQFEGDADGTTRVWLPTCAVPGPDSGAVPPAGYEYFAYTGGGDTIELTHQPQGLIGFHYLVDPAAPSGAETERPPRSPERFEFTSAQWRARLLERDGVQRFELHYAEVPPSWTVSSSLYAGPGPYYLSTRDEDYRPDVAGKTATH
jgi:hypothetical protein